MNCNSGSMFKARSVFNFIDKSHWPVRHYTGVTNGELGVFVCLYMCVCVCVCGCTMPFIYFDPHIFVFAWWSTPSQASLNKILWFINLYPYYSRQLNCLQLKIFFAGVVKTYK